MAARTTPRALPDSYFGLVKEFPLVHIRDDRHLDEAAAMIDRLLQEDLDEGGQAYLDALTDLVEVYEDRHYPIPDASEADVLRELLRANGLSQSALGREVGIAQSTISAVLAGYRSLTRDQMTTLGRFFGVPASVFMPA
jgi:HTH-type transcriptional regulator/antitoxin HigA